MKKPYFFFKGQAIAREYELTYGTGAKAIVPTSKDSGSYFLKIKTSVLLHMYEH